MKIFQTIMQTKKPNQKLEAQLQRARWLMLGWIEDLPHLASKTPPDAVAALQADLRRIVEEHCPRKPVARF